jgi:hypothetical protein
VRGAAGEFSSVHIPAQRRVKNPERSQCRRFQKNENSVPTRQALSLQQQVAEILYPRPTKEGFDVAVDPSTTESHWHPPSFEGLPGSEQHLGQLFEGLQSLPTELIELSLRR